MLKKLLNADHLRMLSKSEMKSILGGADPDLSKCHVTCVAGQPVITGPKYCKDYIQAQC